MNKPLILVVEDDNSVKNLITTTLKAHDYRYLTAPNGSTAILEASSHNPDIVLLDLGLPDIDGVEVIKKIRTWSNMPIIVISARSEDTDKIDALDAGADDYLTKPFELAELEARVRSLLRRSFHTASAVLEYGVVRMDSNSRKVYVNKTEVRLTKTETAILEYMLRNQDKVVSQEELMEHIYDSNVNYFSDVLRVHIHSLRKKLQKVVGYNPILTKIGEGYYMTKPAEEELL